MFIDDLDYSFVQKGLAAGQLDQVSLRSRTAGDTASESARSQLREELTAAFRGLETLLDELCGTGASRWPWGTGGKTPTFEETAIGSDVGFKWGGTLRRVFIYATLKAGYRQYSQDHMTLQAYVSIGHAGNIQFLKALLVRPEFHWSPAARANAERALALAENRAPSGFDAWLKRLVQRKDSPPER
jgi:hypothetical protein